MPVPHDDARWRGTLEVAGIGVTIGTVLTYAFGYLSATTAAASLGVAPIDFGFTFPDYVFMASWYFLVAAFVVVAFLGQQWLLDRRQKQRGLRGWLLRGTLLLAGLAVTSAYILAVGLVAKVTGLSVIVVLPILLLGVFAEPVIRKSQIAGTAIILVAILAGGVLAVRAGEEWAGDLHRYALGLNGAPNSALTPGGYLNPTIGRACVRGKCQCVVRVGSHILVGKHSISVVDTVSSFSPTRCPVVARPFVDR